MEQRNNIYFVLNVNNDAETIDGPRNRIRENKGEGNEQKENVTREQEHNQKSWKQSNERETERKEEIQCLKFQCRGKTSKEEENV